MIVAEGLAGRPHVRDRRASMGPQLDSCGRRAPQPTSTKAVALQWGRNLIVAEGGGAASFSRAWARLQWGRNLIVAEGSLQELVSMVDF